MEDSDFDAVVVGSGFGGAAAACRLAEAGARVCVLERGKAYPPGSFPRRPEEMAANFWAPSEGLHGLFDLWTFRGLEAVVAAGLGGGSLIYANVLLRKDERWFLREDPPGGDREYWPVTRADLEPDYDAAERMLGATPYPFDRPPYDATAKTREFRGAAQRLGLDWFRPNLAVTFSPDGVPPGEPFDEPGDNLHGRRRFTCTLCGECDIGCNVGAKNTTDFTYLSAAERKGALLQTRCEVRRLTPRADGGYTVSFVRRAPEHEGARIPTRRLPTEDVRAKVVVLAAGALGSTYLLLRNRSALPALSPRLGTRFSGNGDLLGFVTGGPRSFHPSRGPVITSTVRVADTVDGGEGRGFYVQEGGYPGFADWLLEAAHVAGPLRRGARFAAARVYSRLTGEPKSTLGAEVAALIGECRPSAGTLPMLGMGRDVADGVMRLRSGYLDVDWTTTTSAAYFARVRQVMRALAATLDARLQENALSYLRRVVTVHPLGGCPMGRDAREGVVDDHGEVFGHPGLFVADGAVMPGPVGPNPSLTIAALAERFSRRMVERSGHG